MDATEALALRLQLELPRWYASGNTRELPKAFIELQRQIRFTKLYVSLRDVAASAPSKYKLIDELLGIDLPYFAATESGLADSPSLDPIKGIVTQLDETALHEYRRLAELLTDESGCGAIIRDGELAFFSLLYFAALAKERPTGTRYDDWRAGGGSCSNLLPTSSPPRRNDATLTQLLGFLGLLPSGEEASSRLGRLGAWLRHLSEHGGLVGHTKRPKHEADRDALDKLENLVSQINENPADSCVDALCKYDLPSHRCVNSLARVVDLEIESLLRCADALDRNLVVLHLASPRPEAAGLPTSWPAVIGFATVVGPLPDDREDQRRQVLEPLQAAVNTIALIGFSKQFHDRHLSLYTKEKLREWSPTDWWELRTCKWPPDFAPHHWPGGGAHNPTQHATLYTPKRSWESLPETVRDRLQEYGFGMDDMHRPLEDLSSPPVRSLLQDYVHGTWNNGGRDLSRFLMCWQRARATAEAADALPGRIRLWWHVSHDYLWFNAFALRSAIDAFVDGGLSASHVTVTELDNGARRGLLVSVKERQLNLAPDQQDYERWDGCYRDRFPKGEDGNLHEGMKTVFKCLFNAGASELLYGGSERYGGEWKTKCFDRDSKREPPFNECTRCPGKCQRFWLDLARYSNLTCFIPATEWRDAEQTHQRSYSHLPWVVDLDAE